MASLEKTPAPKRIAYLGPHGTFSEEALLTEADLAEAELFAVETIGAAVAAISTGTVDAAFVPIENSIEGSVNATMDQLVFGNDLFIQREVVLEVHMVLMAPAGAKLSELKKVISFPHASAQCRNFLEENLPNVEIGTSNSTAEAAQVVAEMQSLEVAAIAPALCAKLYDLEVLAHAIEDHVGNETRFVLVAPDVVQPATGHDRTTVVCFQQADRPGSLLQILGQFAARSINLTRIESRPTKRGLGDYCFIIEFEGHIDDEVVGDCIRDLHGDLGGMKFLGSYPVTGDQADAARDDFDDRRETANSWLASIRDRIN